MTLGSVIVAVWFGTSLAALFGYAAFQAVTKQPPEPSAPWHVRLIYMMGQWLIAASAGILVFGFLAIAARGVFTLLQ